MANGGKSRLNRIGRPDALPVRGREAVKSQQFFSLFLQADGRLGVLRLIGFKEQVECLLGVCFSFGLPDGVQGQFRLCLNRFLGRPLSTFIVLCIQQRCWRVSG